MQIKTIFKGYVGIRYLRIKRRKSPIIIGDDFYWFSMIRLLRYDNDGREKFSVM